MTSSDPKRDFALDVVRRLQQAGFTALWAGGCVRDLLLGHAPDDYDVATSARPEQVRDLFGKRNTLAIGASFGVILVQAPRRSGASDVEVATFRTEGPYLDGRRPQHVQFATPQEDALRRDFTINGMFFDPLADQVLDYVGGRQDLERRIVRAIGDPRARIAEDKLRMLRAVRMTARFDFTLEQATAAAVRELAREILVVSSERITQELRKMLVHVRRSAAMRLADDLRLLSVILPELAPILDESNAPRWLRTLAMLDRLEAPGFELALATLLFELATLHSPEAAAKMAGELGRRLRFSNRELEHLSWLLAHCRVLHEAPQWTLAKLKRLFADPRIGDLIRLHRVAVECSDGDLAAVEFCEQYLARTPPEEINPPPLITGDDLIRLGLYPGARFKELLELARDEQLDGRVSSRDAALDFVRNRIGSSEK